MAGSQQRGFAGMDPARQREIASQGGRAAHRQGTAHEFTPEEAREAGRKGGESVSRDRAHMAQIGRKGGEASRGGRSKSGRGVTPRTSQADAGQSGPAVPREDREHNGQTHGPAVHGSMSGEPGSSGGTNL